MNNVFPPHSVIYTGGSKSHCAVGKNKRFVFVQDFIDVDLSFDSLINENWSDNLLT
jgi:hypothetical protein